VNYQAIGFCVNSPARQFNAAKVVFPTPMTKAAFAHQVVPLIAISVEQAEVNPVGRDTTA
jgi:hypothetical protein